MAKQLPLNLGYRAAYGREDFLLAPCNRQAVQMLEASWRWPNKVLVLCGAKGSGKTHLTHVWCETTQAILIDGSDLDEAGLEALIGGALISGGQAIVVDNADQVVEAQTLLHLYNSCQENDRFLLLTAQSPPSRWAIDLKDLSSRLKSAPIAELAEPDDDLITAVLMKIFMDRQLSVSPDVLGYVLKRIERNFETLNRFVEMADNLSLAHKKNITVLLARQALNQIDDTDNTLDNGNAMNMDTG